VFYWRGQRGPVRWAFTDRSGGRSAPPFASLNLGGQVGDDPSAVCDNRAAVASSLGLQADRLLFMRQCHGADVAVVDGPWGDREVPATDGLVTTEEGLGLAALVADCTPVLLADPDRRVVGAVHAGRPGMVQRIVDVAVARMRQLGARDLVAVVGPSVCGRCYEVPAEMRDAAAAVSPESATVSWTGTPAIDVAAGVVAQLRANDVAVQRVPGCAREDERLFSYRRDGTTGRFAGVVALAPA
jgi:YfiH family protein